MGVDQGSQVVTSVAADAGHLSRHFMNASLEEVPRTRSLSKGMLPDNSLFEWHRLQVFAYWQDGLGIWSLARTDLMFPMASWQWQPCPSFQGALE